MIQFRCWYCGKRYAMPEARIGEKIPCTCKNLLRVPRKNGGNCRIKTVTDWIIEAVVYGGGGALLGLGLAVLIVSQMGRITVTVATSSILLLFLVFPVVGFLLSFLCGERGINWIGSRIRNRENR